MNKNVYFAIAPVLGLALVVGSVVAATPGHGYVSVSAAAFQPTSDGFEYTNYGRKLVNDAGTLQDWISNVQLPHGATVTSVEFFWYDAALAHDAHFELLRATRQDSSSTMASADSTGSFGNGSTEVTSINYAVIDNDQYSYLLWVVLSDEETIFYNVAIEYTYPTSLPLVIRNLQSRLRER
jgi:hypothetical protein